MWRKNVNETTREEALAALVEKLRKRVEGVTIKEGWIKGARPRWCREIDWFREELEAALALPAAPPEEPSDRERAKIIADWFYMGHHAHRELMERIKAEFAAVRASTPTLTAEDVESMIRSALSFTDSQNPSQVSLSYARMAERGNAILAAKPQKGAE